MKNINNLLIVFVAALIFSSCARTPAINTVDPSPINLKPTESAINDVRGKSRQLSKKVTEVRGSVDSSIKLTKGIESTAIFIDANGAQPNSSVSKKLLREVDQLDNNLKIARIKVADAEALQDSAIKTIDEATKELGNLNQQVGMHKQAYANQKKATQTASKRALEMEKQRNDAVEEKGKYQSWASIGKWTVAILVILVVLFILYITFSAKIKAKFAVVRAARKAATLLSEENLE